MSAYNVVFHMPHWIAQGIRAGTLEAVGGVVRQVNGKQVVMWLRPFLDEGKVLAPVLRGLPLLAEGAALSTAMVAGGAVITVVAFALLSAQVGRVQKQLDAVLDKLDAIKSDTAFIRNTLLTWKKADLGGALISAQAMEANGLFDDLAGPLAQFESARQFYEQLMRDLLRQKSPLSLGPVFIEFANLYILATGAKARAHTLLHGEKEAACVILSDAASYREMRQAFLAPLDDPEAGLPDLVTLTDVTEAALEASLPSLPPAAAAEYMPVPGLSRDLAALAEMRKASIPNVDEPPGAVVVAALAPPGWAPENERLTQSA